MSAAYHLDDLKVCILEKDSALGGRVLTREKFGISYELGAIFRYDRDLLPFDFKSSSLIIEKDGIGLCKKGEVFFGDSVFNCIRNSGPGENEWKRILQFYLQEGDAASLGQDEAELINSFFRVIHPGDFNDYIDTRQRDAFIRFNTDHYSRGNRELIEEYARRIPATVVHGAEVLDVTERNERVEVTYRDTAGSGAMHARTVIVTVPAPVAAKIIVSKSTECAEFLDSVRYGQGVVVVIALKNAGLVDFSYIVATGLQANTVIKSRTFLPDVSVINIYFVAENSIAMMTLPDSEILSRAVDFIKACSIGTISDRNVMFADVYRWDMVGPVISQKPYAHWVDAMKRPSERVFLAGDYVFVDPADTMPYGMSAAIMSGRRTAAEVSQLLHSE